MYYGHVTGVFVFILINNYLIFFCVDDLFLWILILGTSDEVVEKIC